MSLSKLCRQEFSDYLFLARRGWCGLFDFPAIYEKDSYANLCWTAYRAVPGGPVIALLLHVDKSVGGLPWGSVTILNYRASVEDVEICPSAPGPAGTAYQADPAPVSSQSPVLLRPGSH